MPLPGRSVGRRPLLALLTISLGALLVVLSLSMRLLRWVCGSSTILESDDPDELTTSIPPHVECIAVPEVIKRRGRRRPWVIVIEGSQGSGKSFLAEEIIGEKRSIGISNVWRLNGKDPAVFQRDIVALTDRDAIDGSLNDRFIDSVERASLRSVFVVENFVSNPVIDELVERLLNQDSFRLALMVITTSHEPPTWLLKATRQRFACHYLEADDATSRLPCIIPFELRQQIVRKAGALSMENVLLISGAASIGPAACELLARGTDPWKIVWRHLTVGSRRIACVVAAFDHTRGISKELLQCLSGTATAKSASIDDDVKSICSVNALHVTDDLLFRMPDSVRRRLSAHMTPAMLNYAAKSIERCWTKQNSISAPEKVVRAWSLIGQSECIAEQFTDSFLGNESQGVTEAFCDHLTVLGILYVHAEQPLRALDPLRSALSLLTTAKCESFPLVRTLHCLSGVYALLGELDDQQRTLSAAWGLQSKLFSPGTDLSLIGSMSMSFSSNSVAALCHIPTSQSRDDDDELAGSILHSCDITTLA